MAAASSRALWFSRRSDLSTPHHKPPPYSHHLLLRLTLPYHSTASASASASASKKRHTPAASISCLMSGVDGGGVSDDFVSTQKPGSFDREFSVIANMLKKIEPLDTSLISKGVSDSARGSMKQMISTMLGLLPSDQFSVTVRVSKRPLDRLLASSLITGYTLWNAEYRIMLMRNFETSPTDMPKRLNLGDRNDALEDQIGKNEGVCDDIAGMDCCSEESERLDIQRCLADLSPEAMNYIQELESELSAAKKELHTRRRETMQIGYTRESNNDLLKYLRSLDPDMVYELSRPSSSEVKEVLQQLVQCTSRILLKEETTTNLMEDSEVRAQDNYQNGNVDFCDTRDYLAKLLFWCMLLGHHLRGLENRLHLSCAVGLL